MVRQGLKQDARRRVTEALSVKQKERLEKERHQAGLAVDVLTAIAERDEAVRAAEQQAGRCPRAAGRGSQRCRDHRVVRRPGRRERSGKTVADLVRDGALHDDPGEVVNSWHGTWARAQITGALFSSLVWIIVCGLSLPALVAILAIGVAAVAARDTRPMLWWRFGARPANDFQRDAILRSIVPIASLRGGRQPSIWIGRQIAGCSAAMPTRSDLVVSPEFVRHVINGQLPGRQASVIVSQALGQYQVHCSTLVNAIEAYCLPWRFVQITNSVVSQVVHRNPILGFSWTIRWIVFGAASIDSYRNGRWAALIGAILIAVLSWSTGHFQNRWLRTLQDLGDQQAVSEGLGSDLAYFTAHRRFPHRRPTQRWSAVRTPRSLDRATS